MECLCGIYGPWAPGYIGRQVAPEGRIVRMAAILNYGVLGTVYKLFWRFTNTLS